MLIADAIHKTDRLEQIKILFRRHPEGVGTGEIARILGVSQRTARRYVKKLSEHGRLPVYRQGRRATRCAPRVPAEVWINPPPNTIECAPEEDSKLSTEVSHSH